MEKIYAHPGTMLQLGRAGETGIRQIIFDLSSWVSKLGPGHAALVVELPGDDRLYPVPVAEADGTAIWTITAAETPCAGYGQAQLSYLVGDKVAKTEVYSTWVSSSLGEPVEPDPPEAQQGWVDQVLAAGISAADNAGKAVAAADRAEKAAEGVHDIGEQVEQVQQSVTAAKGHADRAEAAAKSVGDVSKDAAQVRVDAKQVAEDKAAAASAATQAGAAMGKANQAAAKTQQDRAAVEDAVAQLAPMADQVHADAQQVAKDKQTAADAATQTGQDRQAVAQQVQQVQQDLSAGKFDGGYYTVSVSASGNQLTFTFSGSRPGMQSIPAQTVTLPSGGGGGGATPEEIAAAVEAYFRDHPIKAPVQSVNHKTGAVVLTAADVGALTQDTLQEGINAALAKAKESGEFKGNKGDDGGYYTMTFSVSGNQLTVSFTPSRPGMQSIPAQTVTLPSGGGTAYVLPQAGKKILGGVKAAPRDLRDLIPVHIDAVTGMLWTKGGGPDGVTFAPTLTPVEDGYALSWSNDGGLENPGSVTILNGRQGDPGKTPAKGVDYGTEADKQAIVTDVLTALPKWDWGAY